MIKIKKFELYAKDQPSIGAIEDCNKWFKDHYFYKIIDLKFNTSFNDFNEQQTDLLVVYDDLTVLADN